MSRRLGEQHRNQKDAKVEKGESTPVQCADNDTVCDGMWEVGRTSNALKQTLRSGKSKGGLMLKLLFKPQKPKYRFGCRHSPRRSAYQLRTSPLKDPKRLSLEKTKCDSLDIGSKLKKMRRRQQIARQRLTDRRKQKIASKEVSCNKFSSQYLYIYYIKYSLLLNIAFKSFCMVGVINLDTTHTKTPGRLACTSI